VNVAERLVALIRAALNLPSARIRCTSVDGYRLPAGASVDEQLRTEIREVKVLVGLVTSDALESIYVVFELGARWGAGKPMIPLLTHSADTQLLRGPLAALNALSCDNRSQLHQFIDNVASALGTKADPPAAYHRYVDELIAECGTVVVKSAATSGSELRAAARGGDATAEGHDPSAVTAAKPRLKWGCYEFDGEEGLFCTACYDTKGQKIRTTRLSSKFRQCPVCKAVFGS